MKKLILLIELSVSIASFAMEKETMIESSERAALGFTYLFRWTKPSAPHPDAPLGNYLLDYLLPYFIGNTDAISKEIISLKPEMQLLMKDFWQKIQSASQNQEQDKQWVMANYACAIALQEPNAIDTPYDEKYDGPLTLQSQESGISTDPQGTLNGSLTLGGGGGMLHQQSGVSTNSIYTPLSGTLGVVGLSTLQSQTNEIFIAPQGTLGRSLLLTWVDDSISGGALFQKTFLF